MIGDSGEFGTCGSVEYCDVFRTFHLLAATVQPVGMRVVVTHNDVITLTVDGARSGLHHELAIAVAIEVPCNELNGMCACKEVRSHIDAPQTSAVQLDAVEEDVGCGSAACCILSVFLGTPFQDYFIFAVAVHIADGSIVGQILVAVASVNRSISQGNSHRLITPRFLTNFCLYEVVVEVINFKTII